MLEHVIVIALVAVAAAVIILWVVKLLRCEHEWIQIDKYKRTCRKCEKKQVLATSDGSDIFWQDDD